MKKIGIFLGFGPEQPIKNQGMGRLLAFILHGILERNDTQIVIASPAWHKQIILDFMQDQRIDMTKIELLTTSAIPVVLRVKNFFSQLLPQRNFLQSPQLSCGKKVIERGKRLFLRLFFAWTAMTSIPLFIGIGLFLLLATILFSPFLLILLLGMGCYYLLPKLKRMPLALKNYLPRSIITFLTGPLSGLKNYSMAHEAYNTMRRHEMRKLINCLNKRKDIPVWFVPSLFWPEISALRTQKVVAVPDVVFLDFPSQFIDMHKYYQFTYQNIVQSIASAQHFICYSDYVKQKHLVEAFYIDPAKISVIPHGVIDLTSYLRGNANTTACQNKTAALSILREYQSKKLQQHDYLRDFDFSNIQFIFYSSQIRPYKNFLNLIKAYEILLRNRFLNIKLIVTADIYANQEVKDYILSRRLQYDILSFPDVSSAVLAALNQMAICAVNPSLFEGGFPFTFAEAYSVGTPSVMSRIAVVTPEIEDSELQKTMLFDPYDFEDMANKIEAAVKNREALYLLQKPLFDKFKNRTWNIVAKEYVELLNEFATP